MKKRFLAIVLTAVMALALAAPGFAAMLPTAVTTPHALIVDETDNYTTNDNLTSNYIIHQNLNNAPKLIKVSHNNGALYGYVNPQAQIVVQEKYTEIGNFTPEHLAWAKKNGVGMYVNTQGVEVISVGVATPHDFSNGLARIVEHNGNTYFIDTTGKIVFNLGVEEAGEFDSNGLNWVRSSITGKYGIINKAGQEIAHFQYDKLSIVGNKLYYNSGLLRAERDGKVRFLNTLGQEVFTVDPEGKLNIAYVGDFANGMCLVKDIYNQVGYIDTTGYQAVYCMYEEGWDFSAAGIARIKRNGYYGYINKINAYAVQPEYVELYAPVNGIALARRYVIINNQYVLKYGYVNVVTGVEQIAFTYDHARSFSEGLAYVDVYGQYGHLIKGFINELGTVLFYVSYYDEVGDFHSGLAYAIKNGKYGYISKAENGKMVITARYDVSYLDAAKTIRDYDHAPYNFEGNRCIGRLSNFDGSSRFSIINQNGIDVYGPTFSDVIYFNPLVDNIALFQNAGYNNTIITLF